MAKLCEHCGKKNSFFGEAAFDLPKDKILCNKCAEIIRDDIARLYSASTVEEYARLRDEIIAKARSCFDENVTNLIIIKVNEIGSFLEVIKEEVIKNEAVVNENIGPFENQDLVYTIDGVRGRHIDIYTDKVVITTKVTIGSLLTNNATDGEKTIYYSDCIGVQFKQSKFAIGYLQLETASSNGNNKHSNFFAENSFTFDTTVISNERMIEVADYVKSRVDAVKKGGTVSDSTNNNKVSVADELLKLKQLLDMGVLSQEEFDEQKYKLLNK